MNMGSMKKACARKVSHRDSGGDATQASDTSKTRKRGIVNMLGVKKKRAKGEVINVQFNEMGQPIGKESMTLAHFIGSCTRRTFPITVTDWRNKDLLPLKVQFWDEVKGAFGLDESQKKMIVSRAGYLHRVFRTRLRNLARDDEGNYSAEPPFIYSQLSTVSDCWQTFVAHASTLTFKETSKANKVRADSMEARYKKACTGYARLREQIIKEKLALGEEDPIVTRLDTWKYARTNAELQIDDPAALRILEDVTRIAKELEEDELNDITVDDLLDRAIPLEYTGRVRGCGWGVTKRSLSSIPELSELSKLKRKYNRMEKDLQEIKATCCRPMAPSGGSSHKDNFDVNNVRDCESDSDHESDVPVENLPEGPVVCYLYVGNPRRHVGQGVLYNRPNEVLHGLLLPEGYARIQFEVAVESERHSKVPQSTDEVSTVGDAVGHFISWPKELVSLKLECPPPSKMNKSSPKVTDNSSKPTVKTVESTICAKPLGYPKYGDSPHDSMVLHILRLTPKNIVDNIEVSMNEYFGEKCWTENLAYENVLEILDDQRLSASSIAFYIRYLGEVHLSENIELASKFSCVSPHISPLLGSGMTSNHLADCLLKYGGEDHLLLIPHNVGNHWVLVAINTKTEMIYFMDPSPNSKIAKHVNLKSFVESGIRIYRTSRTPNMSKVMYNRFSWTNVQCPKSIDGIHCGHYVCCFIEDIFVSGSTSISPYFVRDQPLKLYPPSKMMNVRINWAGYLYNRFLKENIVKNLN